MKLIGFHQLLNPNTTSILGFNIYKLGGYISVIYLMLNLIMCNMSIYYSRYDFFSAARYILFMFALFFTMIKMWFIIIKCDVLWEFLSFTSLDFLSYSGHKKYFLVNARKISIKISYIFTMFWVAFVVLVVVSPIIMKNNYLNIKTKDRKHNLYRYNELNLLFPVSTEFYNENFNVFYLFEIIAVMSYGYSMIIFDILIVSFCITTAFQLRTIASSYNTLGYNHTNTDQIKSKL